MLPEVTPVVIPDVIELQPEEPYILRLTFANGECRRFDMSPYLDYPVFTRLRNPAFFRLARVGYGTVVWPGEIDVAPETLYLEAIPLHPVSSQTGPAPR